MKDLVSQSELNEFMEKVHRIFPTFIAGVIADKHGLPIASKISTENSSLNEQLLSLEAISEGRHYINTANYQKIIKHLGDNVKLLMLLRKSQVNNLSFKKLNEIIKRENPI